MLAESMSILCKAYAYLKRGVFDYVHLSEREDGESSCRNIKKAEMEQPNCGKWIGSPKESKNDDDDDDGEIIRHSKGRSGIALFIPLFFFFLSSG